MRSCIKVLLLLFTSAIVNAQQHLPDSTVRALKNASNDSLRYRANHQAYLYFEEINKDSALYYTEKCLLLSKRNNKILVTARGLASKGYLLTSKGQYAEALQNLLLAFAIAEDPKNASNSWFTNDGWYVNQKLSPEQARLFVLAITHHMYAILMRSTQNTRQEIFHFKEARKLAAQIDNQQRIMLADMNLGAAYVTGNKTDSALIFLNEAKEMTVRFGPQKYLGYILMNLGDIARKEGNAAKEKFYYYTGAASSLAQKNQISLTWLYMRLTNFYLVERQKDSSIYFAKKALQTFSTLGISSGETMNIGVVYQNLYDSYKLSGRLDSAYKYAGLTLRAKDKITNIRIENLAQFQNLSLKEQLRLQDLEKENVRYQSRIRTYGLLIGLGFFAVVAIILYRNNLQRKKAYILLQKQKDEIEAQKAQAMIEVALERVRAKTMAMQKSDELLETSQMLFQQLRDLGETADQAGIAIVNEKEGVFELFATIYGTQMIQSFRPKIDDPFVMGKVYKAWKANEKSFVIEIAGEELRSYNKMRNNLVGAAYYSEDISDEDIWVVTAASFSKGILSFSSSKRPTKETSILLERFAAVFDSTYTRFLDLQKAEAQVREANIEASLERVRSKTMAMHSSQDVADTVAVMFDELVNLGIEKTVRCGIGIIDDVAHIELWTAFTNPDGQVSLIIGSLDMTTHTLLQNLYNAWKNKEEYSSYEMAGDDLIAYYHAINDAPDYPMQFDIASLPAKQFHYDFFFPEGTIFAFSPNPLMPEAIQIFKRFAGVFGLTYRRYLDLQQAEEQAREARIEVALERVRSRTMAMQKSEELREVIQVVYDQLVQLGTQIDQAGFGMDYRESNDWNLWIADQGHEYPDLIHIPYFDTPQFNLFLEARDKGLDHFSNDMAFEEKNKFFEECFKYGPVSDEVKEFIYSRPGWFTTTVLLENVTLFITNFDGTPYSEAEIAAFMRFGKVFEQTYRRYLDLQKAEAQAREAKIEVGLERVRAKAMAMQTSEELNELIGTVFGELTKLDVVLTRCLIMIFDPETKASRWWMANSEAPSEPMNYLVQYHEHEAYLSYIKAWQERILKWQYELKGKVKKTWDDFLFTETELFLLPEPVIAGMKAPEQVILSASFNNFGCLTLVSLEPLSDEHFDLLLRFAKVFDMSYTRFNDLKQAEAQAREAKIEASLEKVRGKAMAMYNSKDLSSTASMVFTELRKLGINPVRCGVGIVSKGSPKVQLYSATTSAEGDSLALMGWVELQGHPVLEKILQSIVTNKDYFPVLKGKDLKLYYENLLSGLSLPSVPDWETGHEQFGHFFPFQDGCLYAWSEKPYAEPEIKILKRFASVIDLTFRRYIELQKSEASAREAIWQASLDRVRAQIASMRSTSDLQSITPLVWNELTTLGVPFIRCGVFIVDEQQEVIHSYLSTPDGKAIAAFQLGFNTDEIAKTVLANWRARQFVTVHWNEEEFKRLSVELISQGAVGSEEEYLTDHPPTSLDLHFFPFLQGMLYVGNITPLNDDETNLVQSLADAFSTAYARYEDFNKLEATKKEVEQTLTGLKAAQTQLIQSEKMASLGELTAGIAHEIQNPLNFVNNFSEVNQEMIDELKEELKGGNLEEAIAIADSIRQNEEKINHHGKRADFIVKGMLQHSRTNTGEKQLTNINVLADEFIKLSYHGLRAKDKSFNAEMITHFDETLPKINIVQQDIGRVLLNLFNNAFYAVNQRQKSAGKDYKSKVTISTLSENGRVVIKVKDNGSGIPEAIKDKIMQPFFTTKPTGEGTGLGLSLSYDMVVKGHGGSIQVNSEEGKFTEFSITLPVG